MANGSSPDIAIIGAGAAGLMAAIFAGRTAPQGVTPLNIVALDGAKKLGAKILVAGGGRCNVTHHVVKPDDFCGSSRNAIARVLRTFTVDQTIDFFTQLGVTLKREDTGKLFPTTDRAQTVLDALLRAMHDASVTLHTDTRVTAIDIPPPEHRTPNTEPRFTITTSAGQLTARRVILATGGKSLPRTGSDGGGYLLAKSLGHTIADTFPALAPLVLEDGHWLTKLSGIAMDVELSLASGTGKVLHRHRGAMLLTHFGLSGPVVLDISRHWTAARALDPQVKVTANLLPTFDFNRLDAHLVSAATARPRSNIASVLRSWFPERLAVALLEHAAGVKPDTEMAHLGKDDRRRVVHALVSLPLPVVRDRGYLFAEATAGGVPLSEIDTRTMQSRVCPGLYLCGEILDVDGRIGGFNFQWAWASGRLAGMAAALDLLRG